MMEKIIDWLKLPEAKKITNINICDSHTTLLHGEIIKQKPFLRKLYTEFYRTFSDSIPGPIEKKILIELGSGGGFIKEVIPNVVTSDVIPMPDIDHVFSATSIPYDDKSVDAFFMFDVLHHIHDPFAFFNEVNRCLKKGGKLVMIEPANTLWGRFIYHKFHEEPFDPDGPWGFDKNASRFSANIAIPWIVFFRDRAMFEKEFPCLKIIKTKLHTPFRYLVSGGLTVKQLLPSFTYNIVKWVEMILLPFNKYLGMFLTIEIEKVS